MLSSTIIPIFIECNIVIAGCVFRQTDIDISLSYAIKVYLDMSGALLIINQNFTLTLSVPHHVIQRRVSGGGVVSSTLCH